MLDPAGTAATAWAVAMTLLDLTYTAFLVPASVAFTDTNWHVSFLSIVTAIGSECCSCRAHCVDLRLPPQVQLPPPHTLHAYPVSCLL